MRLLGTLVTLLALAAAAHARTDPGTKCRAAKLLASGNKTLAKVKCEQKALLKGIAVDATCIAKAEAKFSAAITKAESNGGCPGSGTDLEERADACVANLVAGVPCPGGGVSVGGKCWYASGLVCPGNIPCSCDETCTAAGLTYDAATETYAGSSGTLANCQAVLTALGAPLSSPATDAVCDVGLGCFFNAAWFRCPSPATTSSASQAGDKRACACH